MGGDRGGKATAFFFLFFFFFFFSSPASIEYLLVCTVQAFNARWVQCEVGTVHHQAINQIRPFGRWGGRGSEEIGEGGEEGT